MTNKALFSRFGTLSKKSRILLSLPKCSIFPCLFLLYYQNLNVIDHQSYLMVLQLLVDVSRFFSVFIEITFPSNTIVYLVIIDRKFKRFCFLVAPLISILFYQLLSILHNNSKVVQRCKYICRCQWNNLWWLRTNRFR